MNTEQKLIQRTIKLINQQGYQDLSLWKLTQAIGLTTGAFYKHFKSKDELLKKASKQLSFDFITKVPLQQDQSAKEQLLIIAKYFCAKFVRHPNAMDFLFFSPIVSEAYRAKNSDYSFLNKVKELITKISSSNKLSKQNLFLQVWSFIQGYAYLIKNHVIRYDANLVEQTLNKFLGES